MATSIFTLNSAQYGEPRDREQAFERGEGRWISKKFPGKLALRQTRRFATPFSFERQLIDVQLRVEHTLSKLF
jgi:hypothetical protein